MKDSFHRMEKGVSSGSKKVMSPSPTSDKDERERTLPLKTQGLSFLMGEEITKVKLARREDTEKRAAKAIQGEGDAVKNPILRKM